MYAWDPEERESGDWSATAELDLRFIYHERLLLLELDGLDSNAKVRKYVWGPGSDGRLGGLNSLLGVRDIASTTNYVCFNNGSGSVAQLLDRSDGSVDAKYVYDTRGDTVRNTGTYAADNPLRYRAMYFDDEFDYADTSCDGLYCAADGTYYSPRLGREVAPAFDSVRSAPLQIAGSPGLPADDMAPPPPPQPAAMVIPPKPNCDSNDVDSVETLQGPCVETTLDRCDEVAADMANNMAKQAGGAFCTPNPCATHCRVTYEYERIIRDYVDGECCVRLRNVTPTGDCQCSKLNANPAEPESP